MAVLAGGTGAVALVTNGVLPGKSELDQIDGACAVARPPWQFATLGLQRSGAFYSRARRRNVRYALAYPPGHRPGDPLPLVVVLHAYGASSANPLSGLTLGQACALRVDGRMLPPHGTGGRGRWRRVLASASGRRPDEDGRR